MKQTLILLSLLFLSCKSENLQEGSFYPSEIAAVKKRLQGTSYNKEHCLLVDFSTHSGKKRMFLYNLKTETVEQAFLVAHGDGCGQENGTPAGFSNVVNSNCSSLGFALVGGRAYSNWGINIKYWLEGLDETNNRMKQRVVVLHSWSGIPDRAIYPLPIFQSQGCFTISNNAMRSLDGFIKKSNNKQLLLYAFRENG